MGEIPKIMHQIWSGVDEPLPDFFQLLGDTWKKFHPNWEYIFWDNSKMNHFVQKNYSHYWNKYISFKYNIQRWDAIRYLILDHIGGMYVDFDYECLESFDNTLKNKSCCFSAEPSEHCKIFNKSIYFNNALMAAKPEHDFTKKIITSIFKKSSLKKIYSNKMFEVLETTGPLAITNLYERYDNKDDIYILPAELVSPLSKNDTELLLGNNLNKEMKTVLNKKIEKAIAIHYFMSGWVKPDSENLQT